MTKEEMVLACIWRSGLIVELFKLTPDEYKKMKKWYVILGDEWEDATRYHLRQFLITPNGDIEVAISHIREEA